MLPRCEAWQFSLIKLIHCFTPHRTLFNEVKNIVLHLAVHCDGLDLIYRIKTIFYQIIESGNKFRTLWIVLF